MTGIAELRLDGNAIGGLLGELFGAELTACPCVCAGCGAREQMARLDVYVGAGIVVRCRHCDAVMIRIVQSRDSTWLDLSGTASLQLGPQ
jgi:outer membrane lipoprotein SlyB